MINSLAAFPSIFFQIKNLQKNSKPNQAVAATVLRNTSSLAFHDINRDRHGIPACSVYARAQQLFFVVQPANHQAFPPTHPRGRQGSAHSTLASTVSFYLSFPILL
jgi:hypothetical protein